MEGLKPAGGMVLVQIGFAGVNIFYKLAINDGMDLRILIAYRYLFATALLAPLAFFLERKTRPTMTLKVMIQAFFCGLFGGALAQNLYVMGLKLTSATFASAMTNLIPAITFVMTLFFGMEMLEIRAIYGQAKILGTLVGIGGAMLLTFYKGVTINLWSSKFNLIKLNPNSTSPNQELQANHVKGSLLVVGSCFCYAIWLIIQAKMSRAYPCHYSSTSLMCFMGSIQAVVFALCMQRNWIEWRMGFDIRLLTVVYSGVVASALMLTVLSWCIKKKGPLYASVFNPLMLIIVALLGSLLLGEKLYVGSIIGAVLIVIGLYMVLWGKGREARKVMELPPNEPIDIVANEPIDVVTNEPIDIVANEPIDVIVVVPGESNSMAESRDTQSA